MAINIYFSMMTEHLSTQIVYKLRSSKYQCDWHRLIDYRFVWSNFANLNRFFRWNNMMYQWAVESALSKNKYVFYLYV